MSSSEQPRTDANSRERAADHEYSLSIDQTAELYAGAGLPRTPRAIQKYCALGKLDCHKVETETGEKYLVAAYSVERHIAYIKEVRTDATSRDQTRTDANVRAAENKDISPETAATNSGEQARTDATSREQLRTESGAGSSDRYVERIESENQFLRDQINVKDGQIALKDKTIDALLERDRETNVLIAGLQKMLGLPSPKAQDRK